MSDWRIQLAQIFNVLVMGIETLENGMLYNVVYMTTRTGELISGNFMYFTVFNFFFVPT